MNNRRNFLKLAGISGLSMVTLKATSAMDSCDFKPTAKQPLGPFYPMQFPNDIDVDLTRVKGKATRATGVVVVIEGIITDDYCKPVQGAIVEIWQACHTGKYNHPSDTSDTPLDHDFQYYGTMRTNQKGEYAFKTIRPGSYQASEEWRRPPHIHYKVSLRGYRELVTQLYFEGNDLNHTDLILNDLQIEDRKKVIVKFEKAIIDNEQVLKGNFDMTLNKL